VQSVKEYEICLRIKKMKNSPNSVFPRVWQRQTKREGDRKMSKIDIANNVKKSFRTYHPTYLYGWGKKKHIKDKIFKKITEEII
jgi:hypothetical protein